MNIYVAISCLLALTASVSGDGLLGGGLVYAPGHASLDYYAYPRYAFEYAVKDPHTGDNKAQWEKRDGDVVKGAYSLVEPDGSLRVVEYWADDKSGFNAVVKRIGPNLHPATIAPASIYKAPIPVLDHAAGLAPISVGPVAKYGGLAHAPLISGHVAGGAISSANLIKTSVPVAPIAPIAPIIKAPIAPIAPYIKAAPIAPIAPAISLPGPIYKAGPIYSAPLPGPIYKSGPIYSGLDLGGYGGHGLDLGGHGGHGLDLGGHGLGLGGHGGYGLGLGGHGDLGHSIAPAPLPLLKAPLSYGGLGGHGGIGDHELLGDLGHGLLSNSWGGHGLPLYGKH